MQKKKKKKVKMNKSNLHSGHRERLRKKFIDFGSDVMLEHEIIELLLFYIIPRMNTNETAHYLIKEFKNSGGILNAPVDELTKIKGIGQSSAEFLKFFADVCSEYNTLNTLSENTDGDNNLIEYFHDYFLETNSDICLLLGINNRFQIKSQISFTAESIIHNNNEIKRIVEFLLRNNCTETIMGINHPERNAVPNSTDFAVVKILTEKLSVLNIVLTDCIICSNQETFSLKQNGAFSFEE